MGVLNALRAAIPGDPPRTRRSDDRNRVARRDPGTRRCRSTVRRRGPSSALVRCAAADLAPRSASTPVAPGAMATEVGEHAAEEPGVTPEFCRSGFLPAERPRPEAFAPLADPREARTPPLPRLRRELLRHRPGARRRRRPTLAPERANGAHRLLHRDVLPVLRRRPGQVPAASRRRSGQAVRPEALEKIAGSRLPVVTSRRGRRRRSNLCTRDAPASQTERLVSLVVGLGLEVTASR